MSEFAYHASCVAIQGRAVLIEGGPGSGKSSLALALIDRGAKLIGDDGILLHSVGDRLLAASHPNIHGLLEVRNLGVLHFPVVEDQPVALAIRLDAQAPRFIETAETLTLAGHDLPLVRLWPDSANLALKAELALNTYGLFRS